MNFRYGVLLINDRENQMTEALEGVFTEEMGLLLNICEWENP